MGRSRSSHLQFRDHASTRLEGHLPHAASAKGIAATTQNDAPERKRTLPALDEGSNARVKGSPPLGYGLTYFQGAMSR
jgi:hypothetical protein